jgi:hypothetical protein
MQTARPLPLTTFSQVDYPIELERMFDVYTNQTLTRLTSTTAVVTYAGTVDFSTGNNIRISIPRVVLGELIIQEYLVTVTGFVTPTTFNVSSLLTLPIADGASIGCSYYKADATTPKDVTFGLQPSGGTTTNFRIRANSQGKGSVYIGEILRQYLPEFLAPKDYETSFIFPCFKNVNILFNGVASSINVFYGSKFLDYNKFYSTTALDVNPLNQIAKLFKEQLIGYVYNPAIEYKKIKTVDYSVGLQSFIEGLFTTNFNLYPSIPCRKPIYLSSNYGLQTNTENGLIDVSVPVLAFINRAGQYEYIRFSGSNVNKYNVQEARLKQAFDSTLTNADTGLIYEGIELTLADDNKNTDFPYLIDKLELQRCKALLMESPKAWLLVNGELQQCLEVRVKRESVRFATSFDKSRDNFTAQCEVIVCQPLGNPQY